MERGRSGRGRRDVRSGRLVFGVALVSLVVAGTLFGVGVARVPQGPEYESQEQAAKRLGMRVRCKVEPGPPIRPLKLSDRATRAAAARIIRRSAARPGSALNSIVAGRHVRLTDPYLTSFEEPDGHEVRAGALWTVVFKQPIPVDATVPEFGLPPTGTGERYVRRLGYFVYDVHAVGRMRSIEVTADVRSGRVMAIEDHPIGHYASSFKTFQPIRGHCPLQDQSDNTGE